MDKNKEINKKHYSDIYESKKVSISKPNIFKSSSHLPLRIDDTKSRISYVSRSKNNIASVNKSSIYDSEAKPLFKHTCEQCEIKKNSNLIVNAVSVEQNVTERNLGHCQNFNGHLFNIHPTLCNLACSVPEISHLNRVLNFQCRRKNELSFPKCAKNKQRAVFSEQRVFNYKNPNSSVAFANCKFSPAINCNATCHCSKSSAWNASNVDPYFNISNESVSESISSDEYNLKCGSKYSANSTVPKDCENITDLPILVHSNFSKDSWELKYCLENKLKFNSKQRKWNSKTWDQVAISPVKTVDSRAFDKTDKMLFPALPSSSHNQVKLSSSHTTSMPPSEHSSADNSDLESVHSFPDGNANSTTSSFLTSVSSTIPQASYADVIRMSSTGGQNIIAADFEKTEQNLSREVVLNSVSDKLQKDENCQPGSSEWVISRLSQLDQNSSDSALSVSFAQSNQNEQNFGAARPIVVSLEKPSFYNSSLQSNKNVLSISSHPNLISPDRHGLEEITDCLCGLDKISDKVSLLSESMQSCISDVTEINIQGTSAKADSVYSSPSNIDSLSDAFKPADSSILNARNYSKSYDPPVIIMNSSSPQSMSEISFGIEYDEMIKLCSDSYDTSVKSVSSFSLRDTNECCFPEENARSLDINPETSKALVKCETSHSTTLVESLQNTDQYIDVRGKKIYWSDPDIDSHCNHQQMAEYFASVWKELKEDDANHSRGNGNFKYFNEL